VKLPDVIKRIRQLHGALSLRTSVQIAELVIHAKDDVISGINKFLLLVRFALGSRLFLGGRPCHANPLGRQSIQVEEFGQPRRTGWIDARCPAC